MLFILADARFIFKHSKQSFVATAAEELPWLFSHPLSQFWCSVSMAFTVTLSEVICRLHLFSGAVWSSVQASVRAELHWLRLPLWMRAVWVMPTLGGNPRRRVHSARALEGELDVCHADSGCHIFINLWSQKEDFTLFCTFLFSCKKIFFY